MRNTVTGRETSTPASTPIYDALVATSQSALPVAETAATLAETTSTPIYQAMLETRAASAVPAPEDPRRIATQAEEAVAALVHARSGDDYLMLLARVRRASERSATVPGARPAITRELIDDLLHRLGGPPEPHGQLRTVA